MVNDEVKHSEKEQQIKLDFLESRWNYLIWWCNLNGIVLLKQDENRYNASRGAHLNLKRAEKARILVNKIPGICWIREAKKLARSTSLFSL